MTYHPKSDFLRELSTRGFIADCTNLQELDERMVKGVVTGYIGFETKRRKNQEVNKNRTKQKGKIEKKKNKMDTTGMIKY